MDKTKPVRRPMRPRLRSVLAAARRTVALACLVVGTGLVGQSLYMTAKAALAQILLDRAFSTSLATGQPTKPWSWADTWPIARLTIPRLAASTIVLAGASGQALAFGPGHLDGTPLPGDPGTSIVAAHRDTHFSALQQVAVGDRIEITRNDGTRHHFRVTHTSIVRWDSSGLDGATSDRALVLATCWPFETRTAGPWRYLVHAEIVAYHALSLKMAARSSLFTGPRAALQFRG